MNINIEEAKALFIESCPEIMEKNKIEKFVPFSCPIAIVDADVKENMNIEYESVELLVLRLYTYGVKDPEAMSKLTGIDIELIKKLIKSELYLYNHIDPNTDELTDAGLETLVLNETENDDLRQNALFDVKRELQVEALTGSLIKSMAEDRIYYMKNEPINGTIAPLDSVIIDETLEQEITNRLQEYIDKDYFRDDYGTAEIGTLHAREMKFRDGYYIKVSNFKYPFIGIVYENRKENKLKLKPISLAKTDYEKIKEDTNEYIGMDNSYFDYLLNNDSKFVERVIDEDLVNIDILSEENNSEIEISGENVIENEDIDELVEKSNENSEEDVVDIENEEDEYDDEDDYFADEEIDELDEGDNDE